MIKSLTKLSLVFTICLVSEKMKLKNKLTLDLAE